MTHRQYTTWQRWLEDQWNVPDRTDHYLMQVAAEARRSLVKKPNSVQLRDMKIRFTQETSRKRDPGQERLEREKASAASMANWFAAFGGKVRIKDPITGEIRDPPKR